MLSHLSPLSKYSLKRLREEVLPANLELVRRGLGRMFGNASSLGPAHLVLSRAGAEIGGVVLTHSEYATAWAQARRLIPRFGTSAIGKPRHGRQVRKHGSRAHYGQSKESK